MFGLKLPWQLSFLLRAVWLGGVMLILGAILFASGRPTSAQREIGLVMMFGALPFGVLVDGEFGLSSLPENFARFAVSRLE